jgi:hypothetical protein
MDTSFAYLTSCIHIAANRRHRSTFNDMSDEGKCKFFNKMFETAGLYVYFKLLFHRICPPTFEKDSIFESDG